MKLVLQAFIIAFLQAFIIVLLMVLSAIVFNVSPTNVFVVIGSLLVGTIITEAIYFKKLQKEIDKKENKKEKRLKNENKTG